MAKDAWQIESSESMVKPLYRQGGLWWVYLVLDAPGGSGIHVKACGEGGDRQRSTRVLVVLLLAVSQAPLCQLLRTCTRTPLASHS